MRFLILSMSALCAACFGVTCAVAQSGQWGQAADQIPPYHTHFDRYLGHDHVYPDRGAVVRDVPQGAIGVNYAGVSYRFAGGVWYQPLGPAYIVVAPPIGVMVPQLPSFATSFDSGGETYLYANDVFYRPRPDLGGYEVVNNPQDIAPQASQAPSAASTAAAAAPPPAVIPSPDATPQANAAPVNPAPAPVPVQMPVQANRATTPPVTTPAVPSSVTPAPANPTRVMIQPRNGQSADQQANDRYECYRFAVAQSGFDPLASNSGGPAEVAQRSADYSRAQAACLDGRGYTVQ
jgi:hypothetical protein